MCRLISGACRASLPRITSLHHPASHLSSLPSPCFTVPLSFPPSLQPFFHLIYIPSFSLAFYSFLPHPTHPLTIINLTASEPLSLLLLHTSSYHSGNLSLSSFSCHNFPPSFVLSFSSTCSLSLRYFHLFFTFFA